MRNILYISLFGEIGGGEVSLLAILKNLDKRQFSPRVISYTAGELINEINQLNIEVSILKKGSFYANLMLIFRILRYIKKNKIDLVHVNSLDICAGLAAFFGGVPFIGHLRVIFPFTWRDMLFVSLSRKVIAVSNAAKDEFCAKLPRCRDKFIIIANSVEIPDRVLPGGLREEYGLGKDILLIGCVGRIDLWKGYEYFIESANLIKKEIPYAAFFIVGDIFIGNQEEMKYLAYLKKLVTDLNMTGFCFFTGFKKGILNIISELDCLVIPSVELHTGKHIRTEGFGRVAIEGMAVGVPVVASNIGGLKEIIEDQITGLLVMPNDPLDIKIAVLKLLRNEEFRRRIISEAGIKVKKLYTVQRQMELIAGVYAKAINTKE